MSEIINLTILGGVNKEGADEPIRSVEICSGEIVGIVGPTGSGKSTLIDDIEQLAQGDTPTGRTILVNGQKPDANIRVDPRKKLVAQLSRTCISLQT
jgi:ABC-type lipoprotein export system ATPase subunit